MPFDGTRRLAPFTSRIHGTTLVAGPTEKTLQEFVENNTRKFEFIYIDGGHSLETIDSDWRYCEKILSDKGVIVFDDYYLNDVTRGARPLVDSLLSNPAYRVRFFPMIEDIIEDLQITMVTVEKS